MPDCWGNSSLDTQSYREPPPWPNGQGVGLLIRRLRVRVPQGGCHFRASIRKSDIAAESFEIAMEGYAEAFVDAIW